MLDRVASVFRRRAFNIESLSVGPAESPALSRMTVVMRGDPDEARRAQCNLAKLINVVRVENISPLPAVERHLALVKVRSDASVRREILQICDVFRARVVDIGNHALIVESTGTARKIEGLLEVLRPFEILEMARAGAVSMTGGASPGEQSEAPEMREERLAS